MLLAFDRVSDDPDSRYYQQFWGWPRLPTVHFLNAVRPWFPPVVGGFSGDSYSFVVTGSRILKALERPIPLRFPEETPLADILKYIENATRDRDGKSIPIYVDPIGLLEAERSLASRVSIDLEGVELKESLRLCLKVLDLRYEVSHGILVITSVEDETPAPVSDDPVLIVGQCLLALIAAGLGGAVCALVSGMRRAPAG